MAGVNGLVQAAFAPLYAINLWLCFTLNYVPLWKYQASDSEKTGAFGM
jgi:hypothetical protein